MLSHETRLRRSTFKTETFHFFKLSRPRRDVQPSRPRRDEMFQKTSRDRDARPRRSKKTYQDRSVTVLKHQLVRSVTWQRVSCRSDPLFSSWYIRFACMFTRLKSQDRDIISSRPRWDRDVEPSRPRRDRDVRFFQTLETETETVQPSRPRRNVPKKRLETASRPRRSRPRLHPWLIGWQWWQHNDIADALCDMYKSCVPLTLGTVCLH